MKTERFSTRALKFRLSDENYDFPQVTESGVLIEVIEKYGWLQVMIPVSEDTTTEELREAIPLALEWRNRLLKWQGPWVTGGINHLYMSLHEEHVRDISYAGLAKRINKKIAEHLYEVVEYMKEYELAKNDFKIMMDFYLWEPKANSSSFEHAKSLLSAMGFDENETMEIIRDGVSQIENGNSPFIEGYPITRDKVRYRIRKWRGSKKFQIYEEKAKEAEAKAFGANQKK